MALPKAVSNLVDGLRKNWEERRKEAQEYRQMELEASKAYKAVYKTAYKDNLVKAATIKAKQDAHARFNSTQPQKTGFMRDMSQVAQQFEGVPAAMELAFNGTMPKGYKIREDV